MALQMKISKRSAARRGLLLLGTYLFLLALSYGFPVTCDDWYFTARSPVDLYNAYYRGYTLSVSHAIAFNGRYLGNFLVGFLGSSETMRHIVSNLILLGVLLAVCKLCQVRKPSWYAVAAALVICLPPTLYAQTYAWSAGFLNYVPPALLVLLYFDQADRCFSDPVALRRPWTALPMLLLGFVSQFFAENITVGLCLLAAVVFVLRWRTKGFSWGLAGHLTGAVLGAVLMFLAPGYRLIGTGEDTYRSVASGLSSMIEMILDHFSQITGFLTGSNWLLLMLLTVCCAGLYWGKKLGWKERLSLTAVLLPPVYFVVNQLFLTELWGNRYVQTASVVVDRLMNVAYLLGVARTVWRLAGESALRRKLLLCLGGIVAFSAPLLVVSPVSARCVYLPHILMICIILLLAQHILPAFPGRKPCCGFP